MTSASRSPVADLHRKPTKSQNRTRSTPLCTQCPLTEVLRSWSSGSATVIFIKTAMSGISADQRLGVRRPTILTRCGLCLRYFVASTLHQKSDTGPCGSPVRQDHAATGLSVDSGGARLSKDSNRLLSI